jgi:alpha-amylase
MNICLGFEVHQPLRLNRNFNPDLKGEPFDLYFNNAWNKMILERVAKKCYFPANEVILKNIERFKGRFKVAYSISGVFIEQCERWQKELIDSFKQLADTHCVEFLDQTYYHSLASLFSYEKGEFIEQVKMHKQLVKDLFNYSPQIFENTEFIYNNSIAKCVEKLGYKGIFTEGAERILGWRSPNYVYKAKDSSIKILLRNYRLSDDIAFRFSAGWWSEHPLTADKYAAWLAACNGQCINIFIDYETFGEHQWRETGILEFLRWLPEEVLKYENLQFSTPLEIIERHKPVDELDVHDFATLSWADIERDTGAWLSNDMQRTCYNAVKSMEPFVKKSEKMLKLWRLLQQSDHFYYMFVTGGAPGIVHGYFSQQAPMEVFRSFATILSDFQDRVSENLPKRLKRAAFLLRILPPERAFHYYENGNYTGISAHSLEEFRDTIMLVPARCISFHLASRDFENWIRFTIGDKKLANEIKKIKPEEAQQKLYHAVKKRCEEIWKH